MERSADELQWLACSDQVHALGNEHLHCHLPPWFIKAIEKIMKAFLWAGPNEVQGGKCLLA
jgi:hypothetical protein